MPMRIYSFLAPLSWIIITEVYFSFSFISDLLNSHFILSYFVHLYFWEYSFKTYVCICGSGFPRHLIKFLVFCISFPLVLSFSFVWEFEGENFHWLELFWYSISISFYNLLIDINVVNNFSVHFGNNFFLSKQQLGRDKRTLRFYIFLCSWTGCCTV